MRTNHILIDFESIQPEQVHALAEHAFRVTVFVGATQNKVPFELAESMQRLGERANYIKISGNGPNALDFHIAFYIGQLAAQDPTTFFHIISKDTGFDPLIQHLKSRKIFCSRVTAIGDIPSVKTANAKLPEDRLAAVITRLQTMKAGKPRTVKTLATTIGSLFQKQLTEPEIAELIDLLSKNDLISVKATKVTYSLPTDAEPGGLG